MHVKKETDRMMKKIAAIGVMLTLVGIVSSQTVLADDHQDAQTAITVQAAPLVTITRELKQPPLAMVIQTPAIPFVLRGQPAVRHATAVTQPGQNPPSRHLPQTATALPLVVLAGLGCIGGALIMMAFRKRARRTSW